MNIFKKVGFCVLFSTLCFFFFSCNIFAKDNNTLNYDINEHFNYFYEQKNNTEIFQKINSYGTNLFDYFLSFVPGFDTRGYKFALIDYTSNFDIKIGDSSITLPDLYDSIYVVVLSTINAELNFTGSSLSNYDFVHKSVAQFSGYTTHYGFRFLFFDENFDILNTVFWDTSSSNYDSRYVRFFSDVSEMTYLVSRYITSDSNIGFSYSESSSKPSVLFHLIKYDNELFAIKDLETRNGFEKFFNRIVNFFARVHYKDFSEFGLEYYARNYIISENVDLLSLTNVVYYNSAYQSLVVPNDYLSKGFSYDNRSYIVPNNLSCSYSDSLIYFSSSNFDTINILNYMFMENNTLSDDIGLYSFKVNRANSISALSLSSVVDVVTDNVYLLYSTDNIGTNTFYYNPSCYSVYDAVNTTDLSFTNINTNETITLTPNEQKVIYNNATNTSTEIVESVEETNLNVADILSKAWNGTKSFILASYKIVDYSSSLYAHLPGEVSSLLLFTFTIGMIILIWKIFH